MSVPNIPQQQAAPQSAPAPQSNDERISNYAKEVLSEIVTDDNTNALNPNLRPDAQAPEQPEQTEEATEQTEAETPTPEVPEIPLVEVELDGEKFNVPEKLKGRLMADKDYRQKTMALAETRKQLETLTATAQKAFEQAQQMAPYHAQLFQMENRAQELSKALQSQELQADPLTFNRVQGELAILLHNKDRLASGLQQQMQHLSQEQLALRQKQLAIDAPKLFEQFPELSKPETQKKLGQYVHDEGLPEEAIEFLNYSAVGTKLVWKAHQYDQMVKDQAAAAKKLSEKVKTLPAATQSSRAADSGAKDKQFRSQWQKGGGKITDPNFDALLRSKLRG